MTTPNDVFNEKNSTIELEQIDSADSQKTEKNFQTIIEYMNSPSFVATSKEIIEERRKTEEYQNSLKKSKEGVKDVLIKDSLNRTAQLISLPVGAIAQLATFVTDVIGTIADGTNISAKELQETGIRNYIIGSILGGFLGGLPGASQYQAGKNMETIKDGFIYIPSAPGGLDLVPVSINMEGTKTIETIGKLFDSIEKQNTESNAFTGEEAPREFMEYLSDVPADTLATKSLMDLLNDYAKTLPSEAPDVKTTLGIRQDILNQSLDTYNGIAANPGKYGLPDPIAIDLDGDGIETLSKEKSTAYFDLDKNGYAEKTGWISGDDALLVRDINGNSIIDDSSELFGENTALAGGGTAATGYQALSDLDSNNDGKLSSEDDAFNELKIWQDKNQDGISQADELMSLEEAGIKNISLDTVNINSGDGNGNIIEKVSKVEFEDGKVTQAGQFRFATDTLISLI